jgi:glycosyltransferase involved in cell wall biosynthesis
LVAYNRNPDQLRLGFVGRLEPLKNPMALVRAARILADAGMPVSVRIVGDGSQKAALAAEISALDLPERVELCGFCPDPFSLLRDCQIYVQPSLSEGFGLAIVEAMSAGLPVLATAVGGAPEIIEDGETGWLLANSDPGTIAQTIRRLRGIGLDRLETVGRRGREAVIDRFSPERYIDNLDRLYRSRL